VSKPLVTEPEARQELEDAAWWYEQQRPDLGGRFLNAVAATLDRIVRFPKAGAPVPYAPPELGARRAPVKRFPYHVVYLETPQAIHILAFAHDRRRPGYWLGRSELHEP
jgi:plasmid stabilization system protein ParE